MSIFIDNLNYFFDLLNFKQKDIAIALKISDATISKWKIGAFEPRRHNLKKLAKFFSAQLNISYDIFNNGRALLEKDFEEILTSNGSAQGLQIRDNSTPYAGEVTGKQSIQNKTARKLTSREQELIYQFSDIRYGNPNAPLTDEDCNNLLRLASITKMDPDMHITIINLIKSLKGYIHDTQTNHPGDREK